MPSSKCSNVPDGRVTLAREMRRPLAQPAAAVEQSCACRQTRHVTLHDAELFLAQHAVDRGRRSARLAPDFGPIVGHERDFVLGGGCGFDGHVVFAHIGLSIIAGRPV
jgi:hypothetical protein